MLIQCTKKLLEELKLPAAASEVEYDPLTSWHANIITVNRRKTVVAINDSCNYGVVLYGLKAKDFQNLGNIIINAVRENLLSECIKPDVIDKFIPILSKVSYSKTKNASMVSRINKACEYVNYRRKYLNSDKVNQLQIGRNLSRRPFKLKGTNGYLFPHAELFKLLQQFTDGEVFSCTAMELNVKLEMESFDIQRRLIVPGSYTFEQLHKILQVAFGWQNYHMHEFAVLGEENNLVANIVPFNDENFSEFENVPQVMESECKLSDYLMKYKNILYTYDFGDNWTHIITVDKILENYDKNYTVCVDGVGDAPPEDVGGEYGYQEFIDIISNPSNPDYEEMIEFGKERGYSKFNIENINKQIRLWVDY